MRGREQIDEALASLRREIEAVVRQEQMTDQLTGLGNGAALEEWTAKEVEDGRRFWCAMIEVDHFKRVNDQFGYTNADLVLTKIGGRLQSAEDYLGTVLAVRAHGDEFFLAGELSPDGGEVERVLAALEQVRTEVAAIRVTAKQPAGTMECTVSIGWAISDDGESDLVITPREILQMLEAAVHEAKARGRNRVVRFEPSMRKKLRHSLRDTCSTCRASFVVDVPDDDTRSEDLFCPNCGERHPRGPKPSQ